MTAPDMIEPVTHEKTMNATRNTPSRWSFRLGPDPGLHG
jgi:hypothetical protein